MQQPAGGNKKEPVADLALGVVKGWRDSVRETGGCGPLLLIEDGGLRRSDICSSPFPPESGKIGIANLLYRTFSTSPAPSMTSLPVSSVYPAWIRLPLPGEDWLSPVHLALRALSWCCSGVLISLINSVPFSLPADARGPSPSVQWLDWGGSDLSVGLVCVSPWASGVFELAQSQWGRGSPGALGTLSWLHLCSCKTQWASCTELLLLKSQYILRMWI